MLAPAGAAIAAESAMFRSLESLGGKFFWGYAIGLTRTWPFFTLNDQQDQPPVAVSTAGAATYTVLQIMRGTIQRDPNGASRTDTLPTAALLIAGLAGRYTLASDGDELQFRLQNTADAAETITLAAGANCTITGDLVVLRGETRLITVTRLTSTTCSVSVLNPFTVAGAVTRPATVLATAGAGTYTAAALLSGFIARDPNGAARTDTTATGTQLDTAAPGLQIGSYFDVQVQNTADAAETITLAGGSGVALIGTIDAVQNETIFIRVVKLGTASYMVREL